MATNRRFDPMTGEPINIDSNSEDKRRKKIKLGILCVIIGIVVLIAAIFAIGFLKKERVDLMEGLIYPTYEGYDGSGYIATYPQMGDIKFKTSGTVTDEFAESVKYEVKTKKNGKLKNGDKIKIVAKYDKQLAKECNIRVTKHTKTIKVKGLRARFKEDGSDISEEELGILANYMQADLYDEYADEIDFNVEELTKLFFVHESGKLDEGDALVGIFKASVGQDYYYDDEDDEEEEPEYYYYTVIVSPLDKSINIKNIYDAEDEGEISCYSIGYEDDAETAYKALKRRNSKNKVTELNIDKVKYVLN